MPQAFRRVTSPLSPATIYLFIWAAFTFSNAVAFTLIQVFYVRDLDLDPLSLVLIGSVLEGACFLLGIPTGIYADLHSRRASVLIGLALAAAGFGVLSAAPGLALVLLAMVLWGAGFTFIAGAAEAWLTDQVGEEQTAVVFHREQQINLTAGFAGILTAGALGVLGLRVPVAVAAGLLGAVTVFTSLAMREPQRPTRVPRNTRIETRAAVALVREGLAVAARRPLVRALLLVTLIGGISSEAFDRLWTLRILDGFTLPTLPGGLGEEAWFTAIVLISSLISLTASLLATRFAARPLHAAHPNRLLAGLVVVQVVGMVGLALLGNLWLALTAMWLRDAALVIARPIEAAWLNRNADDRSRATVFSLSGQADALGQIAGGPAIGALATTRGLTTGLLASALVLLPAAAIYARR